MRINISNVEDLVFYDQKLWRKLPEFRNLFGQWALAKQTSGLKELGRRALWDFINSLEGEHIQILEKHLGTSVTVDKMDYHLVKNVDFPLDEAKARLKGMDAYDYFSIYRDGNRLYLSFWR